PFTDPVICDWPPANSAGTFDPSAIVEENEDGSVRVYVYWGMKKGDRWAEVDPTDMHTIIDPLTRQADREAWCTTLDSVAIPHATLFEASSIKKVAPGKYVFIYSSNELRSGLTYCYGDSPTGPWTYGGVIVQNNIDWKEGNNHGSIVRVKDQWYVVYHKPTFDSKNRQAMIEPIDVLIDGDAVRIPQVAMTSQGIHATGIGAFRRYNANIACSITGSEAYLDGTRRDPAGWNPIVGIDGPLTTVGFKYFDFGRQAISYADSLQLSLNVSVNHPTTLEVFVASPAKGTDSEEKIALGKTLLKKTGSSGFTDVVLPLNGLEDHPTLRARGGLKGKWAVYLSISGKEEDLLELAAIEFVLGNAPTPNPLFPIRKEKGGENLTTIPTRAEAGTSVKIILPAAAATRGKLRLVNEKGQAIPYRYNAVVPHGPLSVNFRMPESAVRISWQN
ncbi:MAG: hypothetical protein AAFN92_15000, partial [Bacteroidota bacterium]